jgi:hypothetical protein
VRTRAAASSPSVGLGAIEERRYTAFESSADLLDDDVVV